VGLAATLYAHPRLGHASDRETEAVVRWMMDALVDAALREAK
jgi:hypothetical protein